MNKIVKITIIILSVAFVFSAVSCQLFQREDQNIGTETEPVTEDGEDGSTEEALSSPEKIVIWESTGPRIRLKLTEDIDLFMSENPDVDIEIRHVRNNEELMDEFRASSLAGSGPDVVVTGFDSVKEVASENVGKPLEEEFDYESIIGGLNEISEFEGSSYIIPFRVTDFMMLFYNKDALEEVPRDFERIISYSMEAYNAENQTYGFLLNSQEPEWVIPFIGGYSDWIVDYYDDSITLDTQAMEDTIDFLINVHNELEVFPYAIDYEDMDILFKSGNAHMIVNGLWALSEYKEENIDFGVSIIPEVYDGDQNPTPIIDGIGFIININCYNEKLEAAKRFIDFMLQEDKQVEWIESTNTFPVLDNLDDNEIILQDEHIYYAYRQSKLCRGKPREELLRPIRDSLRINIESVLKNNISVEEVIGKIQEDALNLRNGSMNIEDLSAEEI